MTLKSVRTLACLVAAIAGTAFPQGVFPGGGGGAANVSTECGAGSTTSCTVSGLSLTALDPAVLQCHTATAIVTISSFSSAGTPINSVTMNYSATSGVVCTVNTSGATGPAGTPAGANNGAQNFTGATSVSIAGKGTPNVLVSCYDNASPANQIAFNSLTVSQSSPYNVTVGFSSAQSGYCAINSAGSGYIGNSSIDSSGNVSANSFTSAPSGNGALKLPGSGGNTVTIAATSSQQGGTVDVPPALNSGTYTMGLQPVACAGTPGNTVAPYLAMCATTAGQLYLCNNSANCAVAADWLQASLTPGYTVTLAGTGTAPTISFPSSGTYTLATGTELVNGGAAGTPASINLSNASSLPCSALPALTGAVTTAAGSCATAAGTVPTLAASTNNFTGIQNATRSPGFTTVSDGFQAFDTTAATSATNLSYGLMFDSEGEDWVALTAPAAPTSAAPTSGGSCTSGTHYWAVTFLNSAGETTIGTASTQQTCSSGNGTEALTAIPAGPTGTTGRNVYRTAAGTSTPYLLDCASAPCISNNTTTTFSDTLADASLGANPPASNTTGNSESVACGWFTSPVTGTTPANSGMALDCNQNGAGWVNALSVTTAGLLTIPSGEAALGSNDLIDSPVNATLYVTNHAGTGVGFANSTESAYICYNTSTFALGYDTSTCGSSLLSMKENISDLDGSSALSELMNMRPVTFDWKPGTRSPDPVNGLHDVGMIADWTAAVNPLLGAHKPDGALENWKDREVLATAIKAIQQQQGEIEALKSEVAALRAR